VGLGARFSLHINSAFKLSTFQKPFSSSSLCPLTLEVTPFSVPVLRCCSIVVVAHNFDLAFKPAMKIREEADGVSLISGLPNSRAAPLIKSVFYITAM
jgi:hypothetical protein